VPLRRADPHARRAVSQRVIEGGEAVRREREEDWMRLTEASLTAMRRLDFRFQPQRPEHEG